MYPSISIITLNYNAEPVIWKKVLDSIRMQDYPKKNIEHLVIDGGSINNSLILAKKYGCKIYSMPQLKDNSEGRKGIGIQKAKNDIVAIIETDNILVGSDWLKKMVEPFMKEKDIVGTYSMHNAFEKDMPALTKYCALIGINDPTVYYLGKSEKLPRFQSVYDKGTVLKDTSAYSVVRFTTENLPTLGDNGHMVRRTLIEKVNKRPTEFLHTDAFYKLAKQGLGTYGVVKNSIIHYSGSSISNLYKRRTGYKNQFFDDQRKIRSYYVFDIKKSSDRKKLLLFILYSLTIVQPFLFSVRGFMSLPELSWFLHPVICFIAVIEYGKSECLYYFKKLSQFTIV